jgi:hypothetical protein
MRISKPAIDLAEALVALLVALQLVAPTEAFFHFDEPDAEYGTDSSKIVQLVDDALPVPVGRELIRDVIAANKWTRGNEKKTSLKDDKGTTNWVDKGSGGFDSPRNFPELAISYLYEYAFPGEHKPSIAGAEWWVQLVDPKEDIGFHYDKDEGVASEERWMKMPTMSSVLYLTDTGAPTFVINRTVNSGGNTEKPIIPTNGYMSYPKRNRYLMFAGDLAHGVVGTLSFGAGSNSSRGSKSPAAGKRLTFLVNWWDKKPIAPYCVSLNDAEAKQIVGGRRRTQKALEMWANGAAEGMRHGSQEAVEGNLVPTGTEIRPNLLQVGGGDPVAGRVWASDELQMKEVEQQLTRHFFDFPRLELLQPNQAFSVRWAPGHFFGNVQELDLSNQFLKIHWDSSKRPQVVAFVSQADLAGR